MADSDLEVAHRVIEHLNAKTKRNYQARGKTLAAIRALLRAGYTEQNITNVVATKCRQWLNGDNDKYLRPKTLFAQANFENYLGEVKPGRSGQDDWRLSRRVVDTHVYPDAVEAPEGFSEQVDQLLRSVKP